MIIYFARKLVSGFLSFFALTFLLHTMFHSSIEAFLDKSRSQISSCCRGSPPKPKTYPFDLPISQYHLDRPFPTAYFLWLFDPSEPKTANSKRASVQSFHSLNVSILGYQVRGSGLLTGDLGKSSIVARGQPIFDLSNVDLLDLFLRLILPGMVIATLQRIGHRPYSHVPYRPEIPLPAYLSAAKSNRVF
jgi:ABC-type dipeptide/oligopeptide/nickel transport system permease component